MRKIPALPSSNGNNPAPDRIRAAPKGSLIFGAAKEG